MGLGAPQSFHPMETTTFTHTITPIDIIRCLPCLNAITISRILCLHPPRRFWAAIQIKLARSARSARAPSPMSMFTQWRRTACSTNNAWLAQNVVFPFTMATLPLSTTACCSAVITSTGKQASSHHKGAFWVGGERFGSRSVLSTGGQCMQLAVQVADATWNLFRSPSFISPFLDSLWPLLHF